MFTDLSIDAAQNILLNVASAQMAQQSLKVISLGFKEIVKDQLDELMQNYNVESNEFREAIEAEMFYLGTFGLEDPLRQDIKESI
jgi:magnesium-transporting ATPase (P-type)